MDESRKFPHDGRNLLLLHHYCIKSWNFALVGWIGTDVHPRTKFLFKIILPRAQEIAFILMLLVNPYFLAYDVWFLLSFSAIIGILFFSNFMEKYSIKVDKKEKIIKRKFKEISQKILKEYITPTLWATLWVLPIMLFFMWTTNLLSIIANFFVTPIIAIVMIYWFISTMLYGLISREILLRPEKILIDYIYFISDIAVRFGVYLHANWNRIKWCLLGLFIIQILIKSIKKK